MRRMNELLGPWELLVVALAILALAVWLDYFGGGR